MRPATLHAPLIEDSIINEQIELEKRSVNDGVNRYNDLYKQAVERGDAASLKPAERLMVYWFKPLVQAISIEKRRIRDAKSKAIPGQKIYGGPLLLIDAERAAVITMHEMIGMCSDNPLGVKVPLMAYQVGKSIFAEINLDNLKKKKRDSCKELTRRVRNLNPGAINWWSNKHLDDPQHNRSACLHLGVILIWLAIESASAGNYTDDFKLAFRHNTIHRGGKTIKTITMSKEAWNIIEDGHEIRSKLRPRYLPMIVSPFAWTKDDEGGYAKVRTPFISKPTREQKRLLESANLSNVYKCLNALNATPWRINKRILDVVETLYEQGGGPGIPSRYDYQLPEKPKNIGANAEALKLWKKDASHTYQRNIQLRGERNDFYKKIEVAKLLKDRPAIWFPHQMDFRSRAYPIPPYLNHHGNDVCRGILEFSKSVPVNEDNRRWLLIHASNCYGMDKCSVSDRIEWANDHMDMIERCAGDPLGTDEWHSADKPFQFLAACMGITDTDAATHLPIQVDGTCNGLQHYAAMSRDTDGGAAVNLIPGDKPADVYAEVAKMVSAKVHLEALSGLPEAVILDGKINRSVVKPTVMTSVYGVTMVGARQQIYETLDGMGLDEKTRYKAAMYLSRMVIASMESVCVGAARIMSWLKEIAGIISKQGHTISWTNPLGMPVVQPYRNFRKARITTVLQTITTIVDDERMPPRVSRQVAGMAPNFVHSIDATHMLGTALACHKKDIDFASVHDSYWTHAGTMDRLADELRTQFIKLHRQEHLENLHRELSQNYSIHDLPTPPGKGDLDIEGVSDSTYFFM